MSDYQLVTLFPQLISYVECHCDDHDSLLQSHLWVITPDCFSTVIGLCLLNTYLRSRLITFQTPEYSNYRL